MKMIAFFLLEDEEWITIALLIILAVIGLISLILKKRSKNTPRQEQPKPAPLPGEPDAQVVINPTRANEPDGSVLVYKKEGVIVFNGVQIPMDKLTDAFVININDNPYTPQTYHIQLNLGNGRTVRIPAGNDAEWAGEALKQLQAACVDE